MDFKYLQDFFWPTIKDLESAKKAAEQGFMAAILYLILSFGVVLSAQPQKLLDVLVVALCGYLAKRKQSRIAAVLGAFMMAPEVLFSLQGGDMLRVMTAGILMLLFVNSVRGTFMYQRYAKASPGPTVEVLPPERPGAVPGTQGQGGEDRKGENGANRKNT
ncbi:MAG TPA: hypothetical protein PKN59_03205 [Syntrophales bacterium]|nr:hypothetical protein [Syntrophales bacterium]HNS53188.1 hypothetical protein [Syntrophales bacterium]